MDILAFCRKREIATDGFRIRQIVEWNSKLTDQSKVVLNIELPRDFPEKYVQSVHKFVDNCLVAKLGRGLNENSFEKAISRAGGGWLTTGCADGGGFRVDGGRKHVGGIRLSAFGLRCSANGSRLSLHG